MPPVVSPRPMTILPIHLLMGLPQLKEMLTQQVQELVKSLEGVPLELVPLKIAEKGGQLILSGLQSLDEAGVQTAGALYGLIRAIVEGRPLGQGIAAGWEAGRLAPTQIWNMFGPWIETVVQSFIPTSPEQAALMYNPVTGPAARLYNALRAVEKNLPRILEGLANPEYPATRAYERIMAGEDPQKVLQDYPKNPTADFIFQSIAGYTNIIPVGRLTAAIKGRRALRAGQVAEQFLRAADDVSPEVARGMRAVADRTLKDLPQIANLGKTPAGQAISRAVRAGDDATARSHILSLGLAANGEQAQQIVDALRPLDDAGKQKALSALGLTNPLMQADLQAMVSAEAYNNLATELIKRRQSYRWYNPLARTPSTEVAILSERSAAALHNIAVSADNLVSNAYKAPQTLSELRGHYRLADVITESMQRGLPVEQTKARVMEEVLKLLPANPLQLAPLLGPRAALSTDTLTAGLLVRDLLTNPKTGKIVLNNLQNVIANAKTKEKAVLELAAIMAKAASRYFPEVTVPALLRAPARVMMATNTFLTAIFLGLSPSYPVRNFLTDTVIRLIDLGPDSLFTPAYMGRVLRRFELDVPGVARAFGPAAAVRAVGDIAQSERRASWLLPFLRLGAEGERLGSRMVIAKVIKDTMPHKIRALLDEVPRELWDVLTPEQRVLIRRGLEGVYNGKEAVEVANRVLRQGINNPVPEPDRIYDRLTLLDPDIAREVQELLSSGRSIDDILNGLDDIQRRAAAHTQSVESALRAIHTATDPMAGAPRPEPGLRDYIGDLAQRFGPDRGEAFQKLIDARRAAVEKQKALMFEDIIRLRNVTAQDKAMELVQRLWDDIAQDNRRTFAEADAFRADTWRRSMAETRMHVRDQIWREYDRTQARRFTELYERTIRRITDAQHDIRGLAKGRRRKPSASAAAETLPEGAGQPRRAQDARPQDSDDIIAELLRGTQARTEGLNEAFDQLRTRLRERGLPPLNPNPLAYDRWMSYLGSDFIPRLNQSKLVVAQMASATRDFILHNYNDRRNMDVVLGLLFPWSFWYRNTVPKFALRFLTRPSLLSRYYRLLKTLEEVNKDEPEFYRRNLFLHVPFLQNPVMINIRMALDPLYQVVEDFGDRERTRTATGEWLSRFQNLGLTPFAPLIWAYALERYLSDKPVEAEAWMSSYFAPITRLVKYGSALAGAKGGKGITLEPYLWPGMGEAAKAALQGQNTWGEVRWFEGESKWDTRYAPVWLVHLAKQGLVKPEDMARAARERRGPAWDKAVAEAMKQRAPAALVGMVLGTGFKGRFPQEIEVERAYDEYFALWENAPDLSVKGPERDAFFAKLEEFRERYPFFEYVQIARKGYDYDRDFSYSRNVLSRLPPGQARYEALRGAGISRELFEKFQRSHDALYARLKEMPPGSIPLNVFEGWTDSEIDTWIKGINKLADTWPMPSQKERQQWREYWSAYRAKQQEAKRLFGDDIYVLQDAYFALPHGQARRQFLVDNPRLRHFWQWQPEYDAAHGIAGVFGSSGAALSTPYVYDLRHVPPDISRYKDIIRYYAEKYDVPEALIYAVVGIESGGDPNAANPTFPAIGLMGVVSNEAIPGRPSRQELTDPTTNIDWGVRILANYIAQEDGDIEKAMYRYSGGTNWESYDRYLEKYWGPLNNIVARFFPGSPMAGPHDWIYRARRAKYGADIDAKIEEAFRIRERSGKAAFRAHLALHPEIGQALDWTRIARAAAGLDTEIASATRRTGLDSYIATGPPPGYPTYRPRTYGTLGSGRGGRGRSRGSAFYGSVEEAYPWWWWYYYSRPRLWGYHWRRG